MLDAKGPLGEFFSRPILINTITWTEGSAFPFTTISPWKAYFTSSNILPKLTGFSRLKCNLKIKILINGSPFRYGDALVSYRPLYTPLGTLPTNFATAPYFGGGQIAGDIVSTDYPGGVVPGTLNNDKSTIMARSQRIHAHLYPQTGAGCELSIPFVYYKDAICLSKAATDGDYAAQLAEMGMLVLENVVNLTSTTVANVTPLDVSVYVWAEDVQLWAPSAAMIQGGDENADGLKPSAVASTVSAAAALLGRLPIIGPYAMATSFAAGALGRIFKVFGWSAPPIITGVVGQMPKTSLLAPTGNTSYADDVIALDAKNETTVDPRTVGASVVDELSIRHICEKEAYFDTFEWQVADGASAIIATLPVAPMYCRAQMITNVAANKENCGRVTMTPSCFVAQFFNYWRGTMVFRFKVVCSSFHRGRLLFTWEPNGEFGHLDAGLQITQVLDLATSDELVFKIPYMAQWGMLNTSHYPVSVNTSTRANRIIWGNRAWRTDTLQANYLTGVNGAVHVTVLNDLQCADVTASAYIVSSVWMEDAQFGSPTSDTLWYKTTGSYYSGTELSSVSLDNIVIQGGEVPDGEDTVTYTIPTSGSDEHVAALYVGEVVPSLRPLIHRTCVHKVVPFTTVGTTGSLFQWTFGRFPGALHQKSLGTYHDTVLNANNSAVTGTLTTNIVNTLPVALISACYAGWKGSFVWKCASTGAYTDRGAYWSSLTRSDSPPFNTTPPYQALSIPSTSRISFLKTMISSFKSGAASTLQSNSGVASGLFPYYRNVRMMPGNMSGMANYNSYTNPVGAMVDSITYTGINEATTAGVTCDTIFSVAAGTDFTVFDFINVPDIYVPVAL